MTEPAEAAAAVARQGRRVIRICSRVVCKGRFLSYTVGWARLPLTDETSEEVGGHAAGGVRRTEARGLAEQPPLSLYPLTFHRPGSGHRRPGSQRGRDWAPSRLPQPDKSAIDPLLIAMKSYPSSSTPPLEPRFRMETTYCHRAEPHIPKPPSAVVRAQRGSPGPSALVLCRAREGMLSKTQSRRRPACRSRHAVSVYISAVMLLKPRRVEMCRPAPSPSRCWERSRVGD